MIDRSRSFGLALTASAAALLASGCTPAPGDVADAAPLNPKQLRIVEKQLGDKIPGEAQRCVPNYQNHETIRVSDSMIIYRNGRNLAYRNDLRGSCPGLARDSDVIVIRQFGSNTCAGDFFHLVDRTSGIRGPTCVFGEFTPYRKEKGS